MGKFRVNLCVDDIQSGITFDELNTRGMMGCNKWSISEVKEDGLLDDLYCCGGDGKSRRPVCNHVKEYILEHFEPKVKEKDDAYFTENMQTTHGGPYYGGYVMLPHGSATVTADDEKGAVAKALELLQPLVDKRRNYAN